MPLRVKSANFGKIPKSQSENSAAVVERTTKRNHPKRVTQGVRERAGVTWNLNNPPSMLASVVERAIRDPKFPDDEKGQYLKEKYSGAMPLGLYLYADMLREYWEHVPCRREAATYFNLHRLRNSGLKGVGYTRRPNLKIVGAIAPFCHVSIDELLLYADDLSINIDKSAVSAKTPVSLVNIEGESVMCESVFLALLRDAIEKYENNIQAFAIALNLGIAEDKRVVRASNLEELLQGREPTLAEVSELSRMIAHPTTKESDPDWLWEKTKQKCLSNL